MSTLPIINARTLFPALADGTIRLDGPGGSQTAQPVLDAIVGYLVTSNANLGGVFAHSQATADLLAHTRAKAAAFLGAASPAEVGFGLNATALNFTLSRAAIRSFQPGDEIVVTALDHDANIAPWTQAAQDLGLIVRKVGLNPDCTLDMTELANVIGERTRIVAFPYASNGIGTATNVPAIVELAHVAGALAWADLTHYAPHAPGNVAKLGVDVAICSSYKFFGPHLGLAYVKQSVAESWSPHQLPHAVNTAGAARFEHGTLPFESIAGLSPALDYIDSIGWEAITAHEAVLGQRFLDGIPAGWQLHGIPEMAGRTATFALTLPGHQPVDIAKYLAAQRIAASAGRFHAGSSFDALGLPDGALRIGFLHYNTEQEVDRTLAALAALS